MTSRHSSSLRRSVAVSAALLLAVAIPQPAGAQQADFTEDPAGIAADDSYLIVTFQEPPVAAHQGEVPGYEATKPAPGERLDPHADEVRNYAAHLRGHQQEFRDWLAQQHPQVEVVRDYQLVANAIAVKRNSASAADIRRGPGAVDVQAAGLVQPTMNTSTALINAPAIWAAAGGRVDACAGVDVAVIDSGIDYSHPFFSCKDTGSVVQRLYYSGEIADPALPPPPPGAPENLWISHGTHVAGTIGGCVGSVLGQTWSGVAPAAALHNYNVFPALGSGYVAFGGSAFSHDIAAALEDAVADGMDVVNMSLGGTQQGPNDFLEEATNATVNAGVVVVASAGNSGPGDSTVGSPASAELAISVAASTNSQIFGLQVDVGGTDYLAATGDFGPAAETTGTLADWAGAAGGDPLACNPLPAGTFDPDDIALIQRGACTFTTKVRNAENAGAGGVLMYNNVAGPPVAVIHDGTQPVPQIPAVMVSSADGASLVGQAGAAVTLPSAATATLVNDPAFANVIAGFSSRGPTPHGARLKPEVTAPGVNILSTVFNGNLGFSSGTSMSSPHIAGSAAALLSLHPGWSPADVKSAIVNTANATAVTDHVTGTVDPGVLTRGAGLADLGAANATPVTLDPATAGFGAWQGNGDVSAEQEVTIRNVSGGALTCSLTTTGSGIVSVSDSEVSLGAGDSAVVVVSLDAGTHQTTGSGDYDGSLEVDCDGGGFVHAPWWVRIVRSTGN